MNRTLLQRVLYAWVLVLLTACASVPSGGAAKVTGLYSDMRYNAEGGDVLGLEIFLVRGGDGYYVVYQSSEGGPEMPVVLPAEVSGNTVKFEVPADTDSRGQFTGQVDAAGLTGTFSGSQESITLKRKSSYWQ